MKKRINYTDMADESAENATGANTPQVSRRKISQNVSVSSLKIKNEEDAKRFQREKGSYLTVESCCGVNYKEVRRELKKEVKNALRTFVAEQLKGRPRVLVVGLGNGNVTADALGARVIEKLIVTRKIIEDDFYKSNRMINLAGLAPGVFGATGIESLDIVRGVAERIDATLIIVVDTLATSRAGRIFRSFQLTDAGLQPGSATGIPRPKINYKSVGIPVIAIGVPIAIYARSIVYDAVDKALPNASASAKINAVESVLGGENTSLLLTPKEVDEGVKYCAEIVADAINLCFHNTIKSD